MCDPFLRPQMCNITHECVVIDGNSARSARSNNSRAAHRTSHPSYDQLLQATTEYHSKSKSKKVKSILTSADS